MLADHSIGAVHWKRCDIATIINPQREEYSEAERCSDQECVHFVLPITNCARPRSGGSGASLCAIESAMIGAGVVSLTGLPNWSPKKGPITGFNPIRHRWGLQ
jgi:hypothetical protein